MIRSWVLTSGLGVLLLVLAACEQEQLPFVAESVVHALEIRQVKILRIPVEYVVPGTVVVDDRIQISSRITAFVKDVRVREGQRITAGEVLANLDSADIEGAVREANAAVGKAKAALEKITVDIGRIEKLFKRESATDNELRDARLQHEIAKRNLEATLAASQTAVAQRRYVTILSPTDGVVIGRHKQAGDLATPGAPIITVESRDRLLFQTYIAEGQVQKIHPGMEATVRIDAASGVEIPARVIRVVPSGDPVTRRYLVKLTLLAKPAINESAPVLPGMFGRVVFRLDKEDITALPRDGLVERGGLKGTFVVDEKNRARFRWLRLGREWPARVEVTAGLAAGERYAVNAPRNLRDGDVLQPTNPVSPDE